MTNVVYTQCDACGRMKRGASFSRLHLDPQESQMRAIGHQNAHLCDECLRVIWAAYLERREARPEAPEELAP